MGLSVLMILVGLALLFAGGHWLVKGATAISLLARVSTTVVALTVVSMGTSMPELAVSLTAALRGSTDISYANVVGSNIFNVGAILGVAALMAVIPVRQQTLRLEYPIMFVVSLLALAFAHDRVVDRLEGFVLMTLLVGFVGLMIVLARSEVHTAEESEPRELRRRMHLRNGQSTAWLRSAFLVAVGIAVLVAGAELSVRGAVTIAEVMGIEERIIGLTVIAMGTSLPELATSVVAARQGESEIALGNVVGSNIFNLLGILGVTAAIVPVPVNARALALDNWVMLAFAAVMLPMMLWQRRVSRTDATILLAGFVVYIAFLIIWG
ncbi:MAG TPA: calcium/sodium antiporter [Gemmatimonadales bacterium]|jgi:cation:H+ antiporter